MPKISPQDLGKNSLWIILKQSKVLVRLKAWGEEKGIIDFLPNQMFTEGTKAIYSRKLTWLDLA